MRRQVSSLWWWREKVPLEAWWWEMREWKDCVENAALETRRSLFSLPSSRNLWGRIVARTIPEILRLTGLAFLGFVIPPRWKLWDEQVLFAHESAFLVPLSWKVIMVGRATEGLEWIRFLELPALCMKKKKLMKSLINLNFTKLIWAHRCRDFLDQFNSTAVSILAWNIRNFRLLSTTSIKRNLD